MARCLQTPIRASVVAAAIGCEMHGHDVVIDRAVSINSPVSGGLTFLVRQDSAMLAKACSVAGTVVIAPIGMAAPVGGTVILSSNPRLDFARALATFFVTLPSPGIDPTARIHPLAEISASAIVGPGCVLGPHVRIGDSTELRAHVVLEEGVRIGSRCLIKSHTVIGEEGFGFEFDEFRRPIRVPHLGGVKIGDDVEIGAMNVIARGTLDDTVISDGVKIDDHVFIAHNVQIGPNAVIIAGAEISGSVRVGRNAWISPMASVKDGVTIGEDALVGLGAVVLKDVEKNSIVVGNPAKHLRGRFPSS